MVSNATFRIPTLREVIRTTFGRDNWSTKTSISKWSYLYGIAKYCSIICGFPSFKASEKTSCRTTIIYAYVITYAFFGIYTVFFHINRGDAQKSLSSTCLLLGPLCCVRSNHRNSIRMLYL